jgi:2-polyprenyl-3-methyl-5-hydroxy-6-metoxy-1,4-benzoquinol methylase
VDVDRRTWLDERRAAVEADYDTDAPTYDVDLYPISDTHRSFVQRVVAACPPDGVVLDIPCGTGRYFELVVELGRRVVGADQSAGMAAQARARDLAESVAPAGLQELDMVGLFDGLLCIDAMEHVPPEDWPLVIRNLARALKPGGLAYLSLERMDDHEAELDRAYAHALARGLPAVRGESIADETGGYHFYPSEAQVAAWLSDAGLEVVDDVTDMAYDGWGYRHLLTRASLK